MSGAALIGPLLERGEELARIESALSEARSGRGTMVVIEGPAGIGKTELRATGARPRRVLLTGLDSLTASERRIAELASEDHTNREIAQMLFITDRTVEGHLTSIFRKLQLDSRTELPAALAKGTPVPA